MLATRLPNSDGDYPDHSDYGAGAEKRYYHRKWPCCSGTLVQGVADYVLNGYFHDDDALLVNLFVASEVIEAFDRRCRDRSGYRLSGGGHGALDGARARQWPVRDKAAHSGMDDRRDAAINGKAENVVTGGWPR